MKMIPILDKIKKKARGGLPFDRLKIKTLVKTMNAEMREKESTPFTLIGYSVYVHGQLCHDPTSLDPYNVDEKKLVINFHLKSVPNHIHIYAICDQNKYDIVDGEEHTIIMHEEEHERPID